jgi:hypothetical protein
MNPIKIAQSVPGIKLKRLPKLEVHLDGSVPANQPLIFQSKNAPIIKQITASAKNPTPIHIG